MGGSPPAAGGCGYGRARGARSDARRVLAPPPFPPQVVPQRSVLDALLLGEWEDRAEAGLFRYDVTACPTKLVPGSYGFIAQCNEGRLSKKRPTEFRVDLVAQPYDAAKFNFTKALQQEVLFMFEPAGGRGGRRAKPAFRPAAQPRASPNLVYINVSPIEYGHVLLVPRALDALCQLVTPDTLLLALQFAREAGERLWGGPGRGGGGGVMWGPGSGRPPLLCGWLCPRPPGRLRRRPAPAAHPAARPPPAARRQPLLPPRLQLSGRLRHHQPPPLPGLLPGCALRHGAGAHRAARAGGAGRGRGRGLAAAAGRQGAPPRRHRRARRPAARVPGAQPGV